MIISLLIDSPVHDGQGDYFSSTHPRTHTRPHPLIKRAADLPPQALVRRIVFGTLKVH